MKLWTTPLKTLLNTYLRTIFMMQSLYNVPCEPYIVLNLVSCD